MVSSSLQMTSEQWMQPMWGRVCAPRKLETTVHVLHSDVPVNIKCSMKNFQMENEIISTEPQRQACQAEALVMAQGSIH